MRCAKAMKWINERVDGELSARQQAALEQHLEACTDCRKLSEDLNRIVSTAGKLPSPASELQWETIDARLEAGTRPARETERLLRPRPLLTGWQAAAAGAAVVLLVVGAVTLGPRLSSRRAALTETEKQQFTLAKLDEAEMHYQMAIKALAEAVSVQDSQWDPQIARVFKDNLDLINASIAACREAVMSDPGDIDKRNYLLAAYKEKANLLDKMMSLNGSSPLPAQKKTTL